MAVCSVACHQRDDSLQSGFVALMTSRDRDPAAKNQAASFVVHNRLPRTRGGEAFRLGTFDVAMNVDPRNALSRLPEFALFPTFAELQRSHEQNVRAFSIGDS